MINFNKKIGGRIYSKKLVLSVIAYFMFFIGFIVIFEAISDESSLKTLAALFFIVASFAWQFYIVMIIKQRANDFTDSPWLITIVSFISPLYLFLGLFRSRS